MKSNKIDLNNIINLEEKEYISFNTNESKEIAESEDIQNNSLDDYELLISKLNNIYSTFSSLEKFFLDKQI